LTVSYLFLLGYFC